MSLTDLPADIARRRMLTATEAAQFTGLALSTWRRMVFEGTAPAPVKVGERRVAWPLGVVLDWLDERATAS
jgi:predicted DNA-binding transcriptional regulator AlpA